MHDYFSDFLLTKNPVGAFASWLGDTGTGAATAPTTSHLKVHIFWLLLTIGLVYITWKAGKWYAGYELIKQQQQPQPAKV